MKLHTYPGDYNAQKVLIAAQYAGKAVSVVTDNVEKTIKGKSPVSSAPILELDDGSVIFKSNAAARYVAKDSALYGANVLESALIDSWIDFAKNDIEVPACMVCYPIVGYMGFVADAAKKAEVELKKSTMQLELYLKSRTFLVGESITLADVVVSQALFLPMILVNDEKTRKAFPCVTRWFLTCVNQPEFKKVLGDVVLCKKKIAPPAGAEVKTEKKAKKKEAPKKKEEPKKEAPVADPLAPKKKEKHPLELLPKTSFVLDTWKKTYSNATNCYEVMPWFWENLDMAAGAWCVFSAKYNYNEDNKVAFMVGNLVGGFIQRCDEIRKYAFGVVNVLGEEGKFLEVEGMWLFRGEDVKAILNCNPDAEYYTWTKMDLTNADHKKAIEEFWCAEEKIGDKPILDCKVFK